MSLQIRRRSEFDPAMTLRPLPNSRLREVRPQPAASNGREPSEPEKAAAAASLPILATANDARELVRFLKKRPNGVTVVEAMNAEPRRIFDARKLAAYEFWGIIQRRNDRLALTELGRALADALNPECRMHRSILHRVPAYRHAIESIFEEGLDISTHMDVLRYWSRLGSVAVDGGNAQDLEAAVVCFFSLCHAAELGTSTVGKRGQPARLRVDMEQVERFLTEQHDEPEAAEPMPARREFVRHIYGFANSVIRRVMVSTGGSMESINNLESLLALAGFESVSVDFADFENGLLPSSELTEMQQCQAGIFVVGPENCIRKEDGTYALRHEWITKISVAAALFDWRILLFWNGELPPPEELTASGLRFLASENLDWDACLEMASQIKSLALPLSE